ncbi:MAG: hypothetical protein QW117_00275 [Candidatus Pacearchaeota archaeon]
MVKNEKIVFLYAFLFAIMVFLIGIFIGFTIENIRNTSAYKLYLISEINMNDINLQSQLLNYFEIDNCNFYEEKNIFFLDKIYEDAKLLSKYEQSSKISDIIKLEHRKFDFLRTLFWLNSARIKEKCNSSYINIVYLYDYNNPSVDQRAKQNVYSKLLEELKQKYGDKIILIPIAGDNNLTSVDILLDRYNITELPTILINEKIKVTEMINLQELEEVVQNELKKKDKF